MASMENCLPSHCGPLLGPTLGYCNGWQISSSDMAQQVGQQVAQAVSPRLGPISLCHSGQWTMMVNWRIMERCSSSWSITNTLHVPRLLTPPTKRVLWRTHTNTSPPPCAVCYVVPVLQKTYGHTHYNMSSSSTNSSLMALVGIPS
jgi:hypothetical protein